MTTTTETILPNFSAWDADTKRHAALMEQIRPINKTAVFDALARAGVTSVIVHFDGCGDSGQIEGVEAKAGEAAVELPTDAVGFAIPAKSGMGVERDTVTLRDAIESLAYDFLGETHGGWEDNEGAYGEFIFDVESRAIRLEYNERFLDAHYSEHEF